MHGVMQPHLPTQVSGVPGIPNFGVLLYLCPHPLTLNNQIWQDMGVLGQQLGLRPTLCWESLQRSPRPSSRLGSAPPILCLRFCRTIFISVAPQNKILLLPSHYSSLTPTYWGHMPVFVPRPLGHACCDHNESESYRPTIICRHCVDQQTDSLVSPNFIWAIGSEAIEKLEVKDLFSPPCIEIWRGIRLPCPTACSTPAIGMYFKYNNTCVYLTTYFKQTI